jgi:hypothetical protein
VGVKECSCEAEHSVAKLGHCADCPHYKRDQDTQIQHQLGGCALGNGHHDGTLHDFNWATYEDETTSTGVCRCGLWQLDYLLARMP